ncbi:hypothetical protein DPMN_056047 [Dreissena polymorpha]|uniref:Ig-like domain-containing protein n=1 Tax=Dreissena polymorpha TaxID=45954 RepID=A0A9D4CR09_DREPO|nr:hypothetical protein DPMN_056047 [Dreissena polymorpha]
MIVAAQGDNLAPHFNVPAQNETAVAGRTAILTCTIQSLGDHKVAWMDPKLKLLTIADQRIIQDTRISVERPFTQNWNLHIRQVRLNDSGEYQCQINTKPVKSTKVLLIVQEPPAIIRTSGSQTVREWETVSLWCTVTGVPFPTVTWYRKNKHEHQKATEVVGADGEGLKIHNISRYCQDEYECVADNGIETMAKAKMR